MNGWCALVAAAIGWLIAQIWKTIAGLASKDRPKDMNFVAFMRYATRSGGMPSGHSAAMSALTIYIGIALGFDSGLFALALAVSLIIMYDAVNVRYAVGEQGKLLNSLAQEAGKKPLRLVEGHTMAQVCVGVAIGVISGVIMAILTKA